MDSIRKFSSICIVLAVFVASSGCGKDTSTKGLLASVNKSNIQRLANLYHKYQSEHKWVGPPSEEEFKKYVRATPAARLDLLGIDANDLDSLFKSERDGEEFVYRYKVVGASQGKVDPVVFERTGVNGMKMVGFTSKAPIEVGQQEYDDMLAGKYKQDAPARTTGAPAGR